ncbi:hypothetical protein NFI96_029201, partial [Prochilodus magdalenae]
DDPDKLAVYLEIPILSDTDGENSYPGMITATMFCAGFLREARTLVRVTLAVLWYATVGWRALCPWGYGCAEVNHPGVLHQGKTACLYSSIC